MLNEKSRRNLLTIQGFISQPSEALSKNATPMYLLNATNTKIIDHQHETIKANIKYSFGNIPEEPPF